MIKGSGLVRGLLISSVMLAAASTGCVDDKDELGKGDVDQSSPPGSPFDIQAGKADDGALTFPVALESAHPYANNLRRDYTLALDAIVPSCTRAARVHFAALRTEARYDVLTVRDATGVAVSTLDGNHDGTWSEWVSLPSTGAKNIVVHLDSDYSITDYGFRIDAVEVQARATCPLPPQISCSAGYFDVTPTPSTCGCRGTTQCAEDGWVEIDHTVGGGFTGQYGGRRVTGTVATTVVQPLNGAEEAHNIGSVNRDAMQDLVHAIVDSGILDRAPVNESTNWNEIFSIRIGTRSVTLSRAQGTYPPAEQALISQFEELFTCGGENTPLTCDDGYSCSADSACVEVASCICPALYQPVCGVNGQTYSNACSAGCAGVASSHTGECGIAGDTCGTMHGLSCADGFKCRFGTSQYDYPFPDAGGSCVAATYCDARADCAGQAHISVPGTWGCDANACAWHSGPAWQSLAGFSFATAHPYTNGQNVWKELTLPAGAAKVRLVAAGTFATENTYDKLEVWAWKNGAWIKVKTYTGTVGPVASDELAGQYFYLHFVSDSSVTARGFDLTAQYAM
jgi:hypothetical protein